MKPITICGTFIADATRSHIERDPYNQIGMHVINELANALQAKPAVFIQSTDFRPLTIAQVA